MGNINNRVLRKRQAAASPFIDGHGINQTKAFSLATENRGGTPYTEFPAGQIYGKRNDKQLHYPLAKGKVAEAMGGAGNTFKVEDPYQYFAQDYVLIEGVGYRKITAVDHDAETITVDGGTINLAEGAALEVDPTRSFDEVQNPTGRVTGLVVTDASRFQVGDTLDIGAGEKSLTFTPTVQNTTKYQIALSVLPADEDLATLVVLEFTSDGAATAQQIVEGLKADADDKLPAGIAAATEDDAVLTITAEDEDAAMQYTATSNLTTTAVVEQDSTEVEVTAIDEGTNTLTIPETKVVQGALVVSNPDGQYKIGTKTEHLQDQYGGTHQNVLMHYRPHGEARERVLVGLTAAAKAEMAGPITFNPSKVI